MSFAGGGCWVPNLLPLIIHLPSSSSAGAAEAYTTCARGVCVYHILVYVVYGVSHGMMTMKTQITIIRNTRNRERSMSCMLW